MVKHSILFLTPFLSPYRITLFNHIRTFGAFAFTVLCLTDMEKNRQWELDQEHIQFDYKILPGWHAFVRSKEIPVHLNWGLWRALRRYRPDAVIISGYNAPAYWEAFLYCKLFKKKSSLWNGTTLLSTGRTGGFIVRMKRVIIGRADRYITYGTKAAEYLAHMGAAKERIYIGVNTVDMEWFGEKAKEFYQSKGFQKKRDAYPKLLLLYMERLFRILTSLFLLLSMHHTLGKES